MNERYKRVEIVVGLEGRKVSRMLDWLQCSPHAHRVRTLQIQLFHPVAMEYSSESRSAQSPEGTMPPVAKESQEPLLLRETMRIKDMLSNAIRNMSNVQELSLSSGYSRSDHRFCDDYLQIIMANGWKAFGSTLCHLKLFLPLEEYQHVLTPTLMFPALQDLQIFLGVRNVGVTYDGTKLLRDSLIPFINNHHSILECLTLVLRGNYKIQGIDMYHLSPSRLRKLALVRDFPNSDQVADTSVIQHILQLPLNELQELSLRFHIPSRPLELQKVFHIPLSSTRLESLCLGSGCFFDLGHTVTYLQQFDGLKTLSLDSGIPFSYTIVQTLIDALTERNTLQKLSIRLSWLTPELLDRLATKLRSLKFLSLLFRRIGGCEWYPQQDEEQAFCHAMRDRLYSDWKLEHLRAEGGRALSHDVSATWEAAMRHALPNLKTIRIL